MIRHVVLWRLKPEAKSAGKLVELERIERIVQAMRGGIEGLLRIEIGVNELESADSSDLLLLADLSSWEALKHYDRHALHEELRPAIAPLRSERRAVDYEVRE